MNKFEIENLELFYGDFKALKNINMNISANEITAFIGPSGCGKSTLLKTLDRMNDLVDTCKINGSVKYDGKDIYSYDINELRKNVAMVIQKPNPFAMSIYDNVAYGPKTHGVRGKKELDDIAEGEDDYFDAIDHFIKKFQPLLDEANEKMEVIAP